MAGGGVAVEAQPSIIVSTERLAKPINLFMLLSFSSILYLKATMPVSAELCQMAARIDTPSERICRDSLM